MTEDMLTAMVWAYRHAVTADVDRHGQALTAEDMDRAQFSGMRAAVAVQREPNEAMKAKMRGPFMGAGPSWLRSWWAGIDAMEGE